MPTSVAFAACEGQHAARRKCVCFWTDPSLSTRARGRQALAKVPQTVRNGIAETVSLCHEARLSRVTPEVVIRDFDDESCKPHVWMADDSVETFRITPYLSKTPSTSPLRREGVERHGHTVPILVVLKGHATGEARGVPTRHPTGGIPRGAYSSLIFVCFICRYPYNETPIHPERSSPEETSGMCRMGNRAQKGACPAKLENAQTRVAKETLPLMLCDVDTIK
ncbi:uncharacterized protein BDZ83DRAFT_392090 [Colletotrichum acutatum]|uniref:Uncharacterized protein n=1 Tax=Glomerella acutata TaxID=27357 RepID=A0AAD8UI57_GLOAC|nr:uncharacterized protein BDZ83DRAFT_392090 [Colletotrichum acutatum]KAK1723262.1 hypothetical protein BDZ83DRAFT_392090 [Colletotrichum acutatum]